MIHDAVQLINCSTQLCSDKVYDHDIVSRTYYRSWFKCSTQMDFPLTGTPTNDSGNEFLSWGKLWLIPEHKTIWLNNGTREINENPQFSQIKKNTYMVPWQHNEIIFFSEILDSQYGMLWCAKEIWIRTSWWWSSSCNCIDSELDHLNQRKAKF